MRLVTPLVISWLPDLALIRYTVKDDVLPSGIPVVAGSMVGFEVYSMGRMSEIWGEDVMEFKPDRFLMADGKMKKPSEYAFPVFQAGPRVCLGQSMALYEAGILTTLILQKYKLSYARLIASQTRARCLCALTCHPYSS